MSKGKEITIICPACSRKYSRPVISTSLTSQNLILDYAVCPHCNTPRFPNLFENYKKEDLCVKCGIPNMIIGNRKAARGLCWGCYKREIKLKKQI